MFCGLFSEAFVSHCTAVFFLPSSSPLLTWSDAAVAAAGRTRDDRIVDCGYFEIGSDGEGAEEEAEAALEEYLQTVEGLEPGPCACSNLLCIQYQSTSHRA